MKQRWKLGVLGAVAATIGGTTAARAAETTRETTIVVPAPPSKASAVALEIEDLIVIGQTAALSGPSGGEASANALGLGDSTLIEGRTGDEQNGTGSSSGSLFELEEGPGESGDLDVELTPWDLAVTQTSADARAALLRLFLGDLATMAVLQSESHTNYSPQTSTGKSSSDALYLCLLGDCAGEDGVELVLLHSETSESQSGFTYVVRINDTVIPADEDGESGQGADPCSLTLGDQTSELLRLQALCTSASGGTGEDSTVLSSTASVANTSVAGDTVVGNVVGAESSGGSSPIVTPSVPAGSVVASPDSAVAGAGTPAETPTNSEVRGSVLARTGRLITQPLFAGGGLLLAGLALLGLRRTHGRIRGRSSS